MKRATFKEYKTAKKEVLHGQKYKEYSNTDEYGVTHKTYACLNGHSFHERTENGKTEFWSTKKSESRMYEERREEKEKQYSHDEQLAILIGCLNAVLEAYKETKMEHLKDKATGFIVLAENLGIINQETMLDVYETIKNW